ncbi:hypothetical protein, partial [Cohnella sp.]|uniref:hypothetical protein n=1 Tax=Cohnella sp. TaxID=1883426 RepID=UPI0037043017
AVPLPFKINAGSKLNVEIDQMLVVDLGDKDGAYREWFPKVMKEDGSTATQDEYVIALHLNVENPIKQPSSSWSLPFKITSASPLYSYAAIHPDLKEQSPIYYVPTLNTNKIQKVDGWFLMTIAKEDSTKRPMIQDGKFGVMIYNYVTRSKVFLSEKVDPR